MAAAVVLQILGVCVGCRLGARRVRGSARADPRSEYAHLPGPKHIQERPRGAGDVDLDDFHFFQDCVNETDSGPGCVSIEVGDFDNDGDLDWFVTSIWYGDGTPMEGNRLYENDGSGNFTNATPASGVIKGDWLLTVALDTAKRRAAELRTENQWLTKAATATWALR